MKKYKKVTCIICFATVCIVSFNCRKFVEVPPPITQLSAASVYSTNTTIESALNGIYVTMEGNSIAGGQFGISEFLGLSADEFNLFSGTSAVLEQAYGNAQKSNNPPSIWADLYNLIYQSNEIIAGASGSAAITPAIRQQAIGESEFIRAFCNFYLVNIYGNIPLVMSADYNKNAVLGQSPASAVYAEIVADLKDAQSRLGTDYMDSKGDPSTQRVRPNSAVATALLARVYLYMGVYDSAEQEATLVINNPVYKLYQDSAGIDSVFLTSSQEAIWQLELPNNDFGNTNDGGLFLSVIFSGGPASFAPFTLGEALLASFEPLDLRRKAWVDSVVSGPNVYYIPYKYKLYYTGVPPAEYPTIMRLAEQYLIRAEARAQQGNLEGAKSDLNIIRSRANLPPTAASTKADVLNAIIQERRVELFTEYGHRWLDIKRTGVVDQVMSSVTPLKAGTWEPTDSLYPIPYGDIQADPRLKQNRGYQ
ncbi:MAG TPA: RagB/SusD family nutrient uptake outer membrane protein [Puia sp.]|uniref:RagB/SusD family nutrient uptake outer membrane protein n=1 Tax=Puia sp. TaxID=2045100 RepID=UPI002CD1BC5C|nr:RagB/SusD family nutrient uptake outer membrane protein [Puia sp.]HVU95504.1 RagB/SusD family nutrient uptake outer membrane protein [Puia sp.]